QQHFLPRYGIHCDAMLMAEDRRHKGVALGMEMDVDLNARRHVAVYAVAAHGHWQVLLFATIRRLVAFLASLPHRRGRLRACGSVGIVAGDARHVALLEASALPKILALIGNMIVLRVLDRQRLKGLLERLARPVAERRATIHDGVAVALRAD